VEYLLGRPDVQELWQQYTQHPFVMAIGNGHLPLESFKGYLIQDYLYLVHPQMALLISRTLTS
jgi:hydroxymethylpyrimidine/phosphomethylpyrimidine kinase / thiaminase